MGRTVSPGSIPGLHTGMTPANQYRNSRVARYFEEQMKKVTVIVSLDRAKQPARRRIAVGLLGPGIATIIEVRYEDREGTIQASGEAVAS